MLPKIKVIVFTGKNTTKYTGSTILMKSEKACFHDALVKRPQARPLVFRHLLAGNPKE